MSATLVMGFSSCRDESRSFWHQSMITCPKDRNSHLRKEGGFKSYDMERPEVCRLQNSKKEQSSPSQDSETPTTRLRDPGVKVDIEAAGPFQGPSRGGQLYWQW